MFLASKFKALEHITSDKLVMFTDYSITIQELKVSKLTKKIPARRARPSQRPVFKMKILAERFILTAEFYTAELTENNYKNRFFII